MDHGRRKLILIGTAGAAALTFSGVGYFFGQPSEDLFVSPDDIAPSERPQELAYLTEYVRRNDRWGSDDLFRFMHALQEHHLVPFGKSLEIDGFEIIEKPARLREIHRSILRQSSHIFTYPFKSVQNINYHELVVRCASKVGIPTKDAEFVSTFDLERMILEKCFIDTWDNLTEEERVSLLEEIDKHGAIENKVALAALTGSVALTVLSATVYFTGFAFYTTMTVIIATVAGWVGVVLPFTAYMTATSTVAVLAGPIGWAVGAVLLAGAIGTWAGQADMRQTTATVMQIHAMKAGALYSTGKL
jgi:uncharacterized protein YaaW (UPF0174 family)